MPNVRVVVEIRGFKKRGLARLAFTSDRVCDVARMRGDELVDLSAPGGLNLKETISDSGYFICKEEEYLV